MNRRAFLQKLGLAAAAVPIASSVVQLLEEAPAPAEAVGVISRVDVEAGELTVSLGEGGYEPVPTSAHYEVNKVWQKVQGELVDGMHELAREWGELDALRPTVFEWHL